jgi:hypothetical protein
MPASASAPRLDALAKFRKLAQVVDDRRDPGRVTAGLRAPADAMSALNAGAAAFVAAIACLYELRFAAVGEDR